MKFISKFWNYLKKDTWDAWIVSIILVIVLIKFIFFPVLSFITGTPLPLVVVESCSMYHESNFNDWWENNKIWYESKGISQEEFEKFPLKTGLNKGDIVFIWGHGTHTNGDIIVFTSSTQYPIIHRIVSENPIETKGDHNIDQLSIEKSISSNSILGEAKAKIPLLGWVKLIFFDFSKSPEQRGFC